MPWEAWCTAILIVCTLGALASGRLAPDLAFIGAALVLLLTGIISPAEALAGFANPGVATVALLYVVATGLKETGAISVVAARTLGSPRTALGAQTRLVLPVAGMSAFVNNTPIVAMFLPVLSGLSRRTGIPASRLFMPLSAAAILGGVCTLIGTSTNVVVKGLVDRHNAQAAEGAALLKFEMFTISSVGVPVAIVGIAYVLLAGRTLLPGERARRARTGGGREFTTAMRVGAESPIVGKSLKQAGLRHLPGLFVSRIEREHQTIIAVGPDQLVLAGDVLVFVGVLESVVDLQKIRGLHPVADPDGPRDDRPNLRHIEAVISPASPLVGQTIRDSGFRTRYDGVIIAVHRHGQQLRGKIGDIDLRPGDTLLIEAERDFARRYRDSTDFYLVSEHEGSAAPRHERAWLAIAVLVAVIVAMSTGVASEMVVACVGAALMIALRCCSAAQARQSLDWSVLLTIGASFGLGRAMESSGLAATVSGGVLGITEGMGPWAVLAAVYAVTLLLTTLISNNAAAVLVFPIGLAVAAERGIDPTGVLVCICVAASCEFATPIGYQTNLMVMGPGGYRWADYLRFGGPLTLVCGVVAVAVSAAVFG